MISQFLWTVQEGKAPVVFGDGKQTRDFTFVQDVTTAMVMAAEKGTGVFNLGTGKSCSFNYVVNLLNKKLGMNLKPVYKENPIKNYVKDTLADTSKMKEHLGFRAKWSLEAGVNVALALTLQRLWPLAHESFPRPEKPKQLLPGKISHF